ncbi:magnesium transporter [Phyllobacterium ifriqiyense]|uniref:Magnesium transporter MgtE n=1 Tax=Phyllobacterium ifriqiyense TaxID=314238 RepID=A0ABU0SBM8_9HYPH|nr:magnesium transporter [Phyllobacterium ifriqiyense]MDQ0997345.1 magnesium transporter [Phyllobacterium ifriqiyense]
MNNILVHQDAVNADLNITQRLASMHAADAIELLNELELTDIIDIFNEMPLEHAVLILDQPELHSAPAIIKSLPAAKARDILDEMSIDRVTDIFQEFGPEDRARLAAGLGPETTAALRKLLRYPPHTAGSLMTTEFVSVPSGWTVAQTLQHIREVERSRETIYAIYVIDPATKVLLRTVALRRLISSEPEASILSVGRDVAPVVVTPLTDQEDVARLFRKHDLLAVPVVTDNNQVIGIVTVDDVIDTMTQEMTEDTLKFGGMEALNKPYMQIGFFQMIHKRAGWLGILLLGEMLTASAMQHFEGELEKAVVLTLFIPLIMSSGGNSGSQATSLLIRALALQDLRLKDWWRVALREIPTGLVLGSFLGLIGVARIAAWQMLGLYDYGQHWQLVAATVGAALVGIVTFGSLVGSMLPFAMQRLGFDPASASAPFVATLVDVTGLVIYFSIALVILSGTLL